MTTKTHTDTGSSDHLTLDAGGTEIYTGNSPDDVYQDLDLSPFIGKRQAWVVIAFERGATDIGTVRVRSKGDTRHPEFYMGRTDVTTEGRPNQAATMTDANGVIEWWSDVGGPVVLKLLACVYSD